MMRDRLPERPRIKRELSAKDDCPVPGQDDSSFGMPAHSVRQCLALRVLAHGHEIGGSIGMVRFDDLLGDDRALIKF